MIGGCIYAVLGVVASAASTLAWLAVVVVGIIAACAGYSFNRSNGPTDEPNGPITFVERFTGRTTLVGMVGWTFIFGYVGAMATYAYAFGRYFAELLGVHSVAGLLLHPVVSVLVVVAFVGLNALGAHSSGRTEDVLVAPKVRNRTAGELRTSIPPAVGVLGAIATVLAPRYHRYTAERSVFGTVIVIALSVVAVELLYFERAAIGSEARTTLE